MLYDAATGRAKVAGTLNSDRHSNMMMIHVSIVGCVDFGTTRAVASSNNEKRTSFSFKRKSSADQEDETEESLVRYWRAPLY